MENETMRTWDDAANEGMIECILDGARGIYLPKAFADHFEFGVDGWQGANEEDLAALREGPDHEFYWESWDNVLYDSGVHHVDTYGNTWSLYQDGDLFAIRDDANIDWDRVA